MSKTYSTQNLYEAAYLLAKGFKLSGKESSSRKISIIFEGPGIVEESTRFYNGALVKAKAYSDAYRTLKDYIFER
jgi:hypothetical protein